MTKLSPEEMKGTQTTAEPEIGRDAKACRVGKGSSCEL